MLAIAKDPLLGVRVLVPELLRPPAELPPMKMRTALLGRLRLSATLARQFGLTAQAGTRPIAFAARREFGEAAVFGRRARMRASAYGGRQCSAAALQCGVRTALLLAFAWRSRQPRTAQRAQAGAAARGRAWSRRPRRAMQDPISPGRPRNKQTIHTE